MAFYFFIHHLENFHLNLPKYIICHSSWNVSPADKHATPPQFCYPVGYHLVHGWLLDSLCLSNGKYVLIKHFWTSLTSNTWADASKQKLQQEHGPPWFHGDWDATRYCSRLYLLFLGCGQNHWALHPGEHCKHVRSDAEAGEPLCRGKD